MSPNAVYWFEQTSADLPLDNGWLSAGETVRVNGMPFARRRDDWRLGRWTAKRAVSACLRLPTDPKSLARIEIRAEPSGAPEVVLSHGPAPVAISISHRASRAACAVAARGAALGCDLEIVEPRSAAFASDYFSAAEQDLLAGAGAADRIRLLALLWSAKESVLKALHEGLRVDTRLVTVEPAGWRSPSADWRPLRAVYADHAFHGWWQQSANLLRTLAAAPPPAAPLRMQE